MLRDEIEKILRNRWMYTDANIHRTIADQILALIAPELEKAKKWDKVEEIAKWEGKECSPDCPMLDVCKSSLCVGAFELVDALNQPEVSP